MSDMQSFVVCKNCSKLVESLNTQHFLKCIGSKQTALNVKYSYEGDGGKPFHVIVKMVVTR
jgi:hypothetical protein